MAKNTGQQESPLPEDTLERPRIVVRFHDGLNMKSADNTGDKVAQQGTGALKQLTDEIPGVRLSPVFTALKSEETQRLVRRAVEMDPSYKPPDFEAFVYLDAPPETDLVALVKTLLAWDSVREAYIDQAGPDPVVDSSDDPLSGSQGYLDPAPNGIDARYAWTFAGGDGEGQRFIDLERGWTLDHEDIIAHGPVLLHGVNRDGSRAHGTSVLGEVCAVDNALGCVGIVPNIGSVDVVSYHESTIPDAIMAAIANLEFGNVLLLEVQVMLNGTTQLGPIEAYDAEYEAIRLATALGIVVVEAGGNGGLDMDAYTTLSGRAILHRDPANPDFRDSGAIIVSAATSAAPHTRLSYGPHGKRIDCYAWAQNIETLDSNTAGSTTSYRPDFSGTSGASPIITGAALAVQGRAQAHLGFRFSPKQVRAMLSDPATGTAPSAGEATQIGIMPNLRNIFDTVFNAAPDVYIRDFVGDSGEPHSGAISASPDIILRPGAVGDPQAAFGAGSGTENNQSLGFEAEAGQDNFIYVRVLNQGAVPATDVGVQVFWAPVSTLVTPDIWTPVGTAIIPTVPAGEQLTVSDAIVWHKEDIPGPGHYCFVGLIGNAFDPAPTPADFLDMDNFRRFIRDNNNVTWRNFNVVDNEPDADDPSVPRGFRSLEFMAPGAPDKARPMTLELNGKLPEGAKIMIEVPLAFFELLDRRHQFGDVTIDRKRGTAVIPINVNGLLRFEDLLFPAKSRNRLRLLVHIPREDRGKTFSIFARQMWEGEEMGRVTWQIGPRRKEKCEDLGDLREEKGAKPGGIDPAALAAATLVGAVTIMGPEGPYKPLNMLIGLSLLLLLYGYDIAPKRRIRQSLALGAVSGFCWIIFLGFPLQFIFSGGNLNDKLDRIPLLVPVLIWFLACLLTIIVDIKRTGHNRRGNPEK